MGGADKGLLVHHGQPLVNHAIARLTPQVETIIVSANRNLDVYAALGHRVVRDTVADVTRSAGPLAGWLAGLQACDTDWLVSVPCDAPDLPGDLVARLHDAALAAAASAVYATTADGPHPTFALLQRSLAPELERFLEQGGRRIRDWLSAVDAVPVPFAEESAFANLNHPDDLR